MSAGPFQEFPQEKWDWFVLPCCVDMKWLAWCEAAMWKPLKELFFLSEERHRVAAGDKETVEKLWT